MKYSLHLKTMCAVFLSGIALNVAAQSELPELAPSPDKTKVVEDFPKEGRSSNNGKGFSANLEKLPNGVKKVALVSFYVFDPGFTRTFSYSTEGETNIITTTVRKKRSTGGVSADIAEGVYSACIQPMIDVFKGQGIDILMPEEFLKTEEQKEYYTKFETQHSGLADWTRNLSVGGHDRMYGSLEGFNIIDIVNEPYANYELNGLWPVYTKKVDDSRAFLFCKDLKMMEGIGYDLAKKLDVDAVLVVYLTVFAPKEGKIQLQNVNMTMFGPNPTMPENGESKYGLIPHLKGQFYCGARFNKDALIYNFKKKDPKTSRLDFTGFDNVFIALSNEVCTYIKENPPKK